jgi:glucose/arabinose dehydrogenase
VQQEKLFSELGASLRDVKVGPDGLIYLLTDDKNGRLLRVRPGP